MPAPFGHLIQEKTYKVLKQYKEGQYILSKMVTDLPPVYSVIAMLQDLEWPTLKERRWAIKATIMFKI